MLSIEDAALPGLAELSEERLRAITGADNVAVLRLRYRAGKRAILHVETRSGAMGGEGAVWFFEGDKARRLARRNKAAARFDAATGALFEAFPQDHRMPQIRDFLNRHAAILTDLTGQAPAGPPVLLRYRPGLSCTLRCGLADGSTVYVKLIGDDDPRRLMDQNREMRRQLHGGAVDVVPALGIDPSVGAIAYSAAPGEALDSLLPRLPDMTPLDQTIDALRRLGRSPVLPARTLGPDALRFRAQESAAFIAVTAPALAPRADAILARLSVPPPDLPLCPIHGDMKLEHVFLDGPRTCLIDTESLSLGLPDYDLAQLHGRLCQAELDGLLPAALVHQASARIRAMAGPAYDWCCDVVALRLAKFHAQRPAPGMPDRLRAILDRMA